jgi:hypothetical protein
MARWRLPDGGMIALLFLCTVVGALVFLVFWGAGFVRW